MTAKSVSITNTVGATDTVVAVAFGLVPWESCRTTLDLTDPRDTASSDAARATDPLGDGRSTAPITAPRTATDLTDPRAAADVGCVP